MTLTRLLAWFRPDPKPPPPPTPMEIGVRNIAAAVLVVDTWEGA